MKIRSNNQFHPGSPGFAINRTTRAALLSAAFSISAQAADFVVDTGADEIFEGGTVAAETADGTGLSLREAIGLANQNGGAPDSGEDDGDTITFDLLAFTVGGAPTITLLGEIPITDDVAINGAVGIGGILGNATLDGGGLNRIFRVSTAAAAGSGKVVSISNFTIQNGSADNGGAIFNEASPLEIVGTSFNGNAATAASGSGGAIFNDDNGTITISGSSFSGNLANRAGGAIEDQSDGTDGIDITITDTNFSGNKAGVAPATAAPGNGGAIHITGTGSMSITGGTADGNLAAREGGSFWNDKGTMSLSGALVSNSIASGPAADDGGGGIFNNGGTLTLTNATIDANTADGTAGSGGGIFSTGGSVTITGGTISANKANRAGGGIEAIDGTLALNNVTLGGASLAEGNIAGPSGTAAPGNGGGIHISGSTMTTVSGGTVQSNTAAREGGGLWNQMNSTMTVTAGASISDNIASGPAADDGGGGIFNNGGNVVINADGGAVMIANNIADGASGSGGGLQNISGGTVTSTGATFSGNRANRAGGAIEDASGAAMAVVLNDTTLVGNNAGIAPAVAAPGSGGGLHVSGAGGIDINGGEINSNTAASEGGGLWNGSGIMTVDDASISGNTAAGDAADQGGGGVFNAGGAVTITNTAITSNIASGSSGSGGGALNDVGGTLIVIGGSISTNLANRAGGAIEDNSGAGLGLTLTDTDMQDNNADVAPDATAAPGNGGAIHITGPGDMTITGGTVSGNLAAREGGGLWNGSGTMTVSGTMLSSNDAQGGDEIHDGGGAIFNNGGSLIINNSATLSANLASGAKGSGGGILNVTGGTVSVSDSSIIGNLSNRAGGGIEDQSDVTAVDAITLTNVTLSGNKTGVDLGTPAPGNGGGLHITGPGKSTISGGTVAGNLAAAEGGGLWNGSGVMTVSGVSIDGNTASGDAADQGGGGLFNAGGTLAISSTTISNNIADGAAGSGGGILSDVGGILTITGGSIDGNIANRAGGGIEDNSGAGLGVTLDGVNFSMNNAGVSPATAAPGNGGALHVTGAGDVMVTGGMIDENIAAAEGGGLWNGTGEMTVNGSTFTANSSDGTAADQGGGALFNAGGTLNVSGATLANNFAAVSSGSGGGILNDGGTLNVSSTSLTDNIANRAGGGIEATTGSMNTITACEFFGNQAGFGAAAAPGNGGAIHISGSGSVTTTSSTYDLNFAANEGGGIWNSGAGSLIVESSTLVSNFAPDGGALFHQAGGGTTIVNNSTISNNTADSGAGARFEGGTITLKNLTIVGNEAAFGGGGIDNVVGELTLTNTIVYANNAAMGPDIRGAVDAATFSLVGDIGDSFGIVDGTNGNIVGVDPQLGALSENGGPTLTHRPANSSPVIDAGSNAGAPTSAFDQRGSGFARISGNAIDIGAVEVFLLSYQTWADANFTAATPVGQRGPDDDADNDGLSNAAEWLTGSNPEASTPSPFTVSVADGSMAFSFPRQKSVPAGAELFQISTDLGIASGWTDISTPEINSQSLSADLEFITIEYPTGGELRIFGRLSVNPVTMISQAN